MTRSIGNVAAILSVNTTAFSKGLDHASRELSNFGRKVSDSFGTSLPASQFTALELELMRLPPVAKQAEQALIMPRAKDSIQALKGSMYLLTGETGFMAASFLGAANNVAKLTKEAGGIVPAFTLAAQSVGGMVSSLGPLGVTLIGLGAGYAAVTFAMKGFNEESEKVKKIAEEGLPIFEREIEARRKLKVATGEYSPVDAARMAEEQRLGRGLMEHERKSLMESLEMEHELKQLELGKKFDAEHAQRLARDAAAFVARQKQLEAENQKKIADNAAKFLDQQWDRAIAMDNDLRERQERRNKERLDDTSRRAEKLIEILEKDKKVGADFEISTASFRGIEPIGSSIGKSSSSPAFLSGAPIGHAIGNQKESETTLKQLEDLNKTQNEALKELRRMVPGLILN